ncbi:MAG TPA: HD domain-containing protein [Pseudonocardia sp.]
MLTSDELAALIEGLAGLPYGGEPVDQRTHALQTGWYAEADGADDELLLAATLHDIGRARPLRAAHPGQPHESAGARWARECLTERIGWIIAQHVPAKRYLVATDPTYHELLSPVSVATLRQQGGPMAPGELAGFEAHRWYREAVRVRRWDDAAKDPDGPVLPVERLLAAHRRLGLA